MVAATPRKKSSRKQVSSESKKSTKSPKQQQSKDISQRESSKSAKKRKNNHRGGRGRKEKKTKVVSSQSLTNIHRCRFVNWVPDGVRVLSVNENGDFLAVARAGSDIELWNLKSGWRQVGVIPGAGCGQHGQIQRVEEASDLRDSFMLRSLVWSGSRLFGAGLDGKLFEVDFQAMAKKNITDSMGGPVWSLDIDSSGKNLIAGCEDGRVRLFNIEDDIGFVKTLGTPLNGRVLCVKFSPTVPNTFFTSGIDGIIRKWNMKTGRSERNMEIERFGADEAPFVWNLLLLEDDTIVAGDSRGHVSFWDSKSGTILSSFNEHTADIFALAASKNGKKVFASGTDSRVAMFQYSSSGNWEYGYSYRPHTHDVRSMAIVASNEDGNELLVSGGDDTQLCYYSVEKFGSIRPTKVAPFRQQGIASISGFLDKDEDKKKRNMLIQHQRHLELFQICKGSVSMRDGHFEVVRTFQGSSSIRCSAISQDGLWIACGDESGLTVLKLNDELSLVNTFTNDNSKDCPVHVKFTFERKNPKVVVAFQSGMVKVFQLDVESKSTSLDNPIAEFVVESPTHAIAINANSQILAVSNRKGDVSLFSLVKNKLLANIPCVIFGNSNQSCMSFHVGDSNTLIVVDVSNKFYFYNCEELKLSSWSAENTNKIPKLLTDSQTRVTGISTDVTQKEKILLWGCGEMFSVELNGNSKATKRLRRKDSLKVKQGLVDRDEALKRAIDTASPCEIKNVKEYKPILFADYIGTRELLVLEANWIKVMSQFPNILQRQRYGS